MLSRFSLAILLVAPGLAAANFPDPPNLPKAAATGKDTVLLAGGCFWGVEGVFEQLKGVHDVVSGHAGGSPSTAHYEMVSTGRTGHAEPVKITSITNLPRPVAQGLFLRCARIIKHQAGLGEVAFGKRLLDARLLWQQPVHSLVEFGFLGGI